MNTDMSTTLDTLRQWSDTGWLRRLDSALAAFMLELDPQASPALLVSAALVAQMEGRGHTCLPLPALVRAPQDVLAWPAAARDAVSTLWATLPATLSAWLDALRTSPVVRQAQTEPDTGQPLVLSGGADAPRLYLRRYWLHEREVARQITERSQQTQAVDEAAARAWLDRLFEGAPVEAPASAEASSAQAVDWQKLACAVALRGRMSVITGGPGTGKTYTAARLLALLFAVAPDPSLLRVTLAAPTGKAAARLKQSIDASLQDLHQRLGGTLDLPLLTQRMGAARTLHALLGARPDTRRFKHDASKPLDIDVLIVDEASMIHLEMMSALLAALPATARVIFLGDKDQLASVEAGAVLGDLCRDAEAGRYDAETARYAAAVAGQALPGDYLDASGEAPALAQQTVMLRISRRFGGPIGQLAQAVNQGRAAVALKVLTSDATGAVQAMEGVGAAEIVRLALQGRSGADACYRHYLDALSTRATDEAHGHEDWAKSVLKAFDRFRVLCAVREGEWGVSGLNRAIQKTLADAGLLKPTGEWFEGRPVMVTRNDPALGVFNGDIGIALKPPGKSAGLRVYFLDGDVLRSVGASRLAHVETAFAMTVHKSQGSEFEHTVLALPPHGGGTLNRELVYTGITRARQAFTLVAPEADLLAAAIQQPTQRASGLLSLLATQVSR